MTTSLDMSKRDWPLNIPKVEECLKKSTYIFNWLFYIKKYIQLKEMCLYQAHFFCHLVYGLQNYVLFDIIVCVL